MAVRTIAFLAAMITAATLQAQVIQLPSFSSVGVNTTVVVPDSGGAFLGGDRRASAGLNSFNGIPRNRGWGIQRQALGMGITAQIHDPNAADAALLGKYIRRAQALGNAQQLAIAAGRAAQDAPLGSVAEIQARRAHAIAQDAVKAQGKAADLLAKARAARADGKTSVAAIYLRMAARRATGPLAEEIVAEFDALNAVAASTAAAARKDATTPDAGTTRTADREAAPR